MIIAPNSRARKENERVYGEILGKGRVADCGGMVRPSQLCLSHHMKKGVEWGGDGQERFENKAFRHVETLFLQG